MRARWLLLGIALVACRGPRGEVPAADAGLHAGRTPGLCGWWEKTDTLVLNACRRVALQADAAGTDSMFPGECGFYQTISLDSLRGCLHRADSAAIGCPEVRSWKVRQPGALRRTEWHRCGPEGGGYDGDSIVWPTHYVVIRADSFRTTPPIFVYSNADEPGSSGLDTVEVVDFDGDGTDEIYLLDRVYGTGAIFEPCALAVSDGRLRCWPQPDFAQATRGALRANETLSKGWIPTSGPSSDSTGFGPPSLERGRSLWYFTPIYAVGDPNCCSSVNASFWLEARPRNHRFETGLVLRTQDDSLGKVLSADTLSR